MMQTFDVDTASELLPPANGRTSDGEEVWVKPETLTAKYTRQKIWLVVVTVLALAGVVIAVIAAVTAEAAARRISSLSETTHGSSSSSTVSPSAPGWGHIKRLAYSSCTSYDVRPQPIWTEVYLASHGRIHCNRIFCNRGVGGGGGGEGVNRSHGFNLDVVVCLPVQGVIPSNPDAWVWLGDFAYFDDPLINCNLVPSYPQCNCTADWMRSPPFGCFAGDDGGAWSNVTITPLADLCGSRECMSCVVSDVGVKGGWGGGGVCLQTASVQQQPQQPQLQHTLGEVPVSDLASPSRKLAASWFVPR